MAQDGSVSVSLLVAALLLPELAACLDNDTDTVLLPHTTAAIITGRVERLLGVATEAAVGKVQKTGGAEVGGMDSYATLNFLFNEEKAGRKHSCSEPEAQLSCHLCRQLSGGPQASATSSCAGAGAADNLGQDSGSQVEVESDEEGTNWSGVKKSRTTIFRKKKQMEEARNSSSAINVAIF